MVEENEDGCGEVVEGEGKIFSEGRDRDHLMGMSFQCELCRMSATQGQNLMPRN